MSSLFAYLLLGLGVLVCLRKRENDEGWCAKSDADAVKGLFILLVFLAHSFDYTTRGNVIACSWGEDLSVLFRRLLGQLVVVMFLFFSGYGVSESIKAKGRSYVLGMPLHRLLPTLLNFDVAVVAFVLLALCTGRDFSVGQLGLSLLAWDSIGNSNWYIFSILILYALAYGVALVTERRGVVLLVAVFAVTQLMALVRPLCWYDTMMAFPLGVLVSENKARLESLLRIRFWPVFAGSLILFAGLYAWMYWLPIGVPGLQYNLVSMAFAALIAVFMFRFRIDGRFFVWAGRNLFPIYIYQRLPMIVLFTIFGADLCARHALLFILLSFALTIPIVLLYPKMQIKL